MGMVNKMKPIYSSAIGSHIAKFKEYKATLIDSVVTGKVKIC